MATRRTFGCVVGDLIRTPAGRASLTRAWVEEPGVVLHSARGPLPNVAAFVAGETIRGSWWGIPPARLSTRS